VVGLQQRVPLHHGNVKSCSHSSPIEPTPLLLSWVDGRCHWVGIYLALSWESSRAPGKLVNCGTGELVKLGNHPKHVSTELRGAVHNGEFAAKLNFNAMPDTSSCKWGLILLPCESERTIPKQQAAGKHH